MTFVGRVTAKLVLGSARRIAVKCAGFAAPQHAKGHILRGPHEQHETFIYWKHNGLSIVGDQVRPSHFHK
jgi:hypothetical protein